MKKGKLKSEVIRTLKVIIKNIEGCEVDYDSDTMKSLLSETLALYNLYLLKKARKNLEASKIEQLISPSYELGLRAEIQEYLDEA